MHLREVARVILCAVGALTIALFLGAALNAAYGQQEQRPPAVPKLTMTLGCATPEAAQKMLSGTAPVVAGIDGDGDLWIIHMSEGSWIMTITVADGRVCGIAGSGPLRLALPGKPT